MRMRSDRLRLLSPLSRVVCDELRLRAASSPTYAAWPAMQSHPIVGPRHCGLFGRLAGSVPSFNYPPAMKKSGIVWNEQTLDRFLAKPLAMVPGSTMTCDGVADPKDRADLIAFLKRVNETSACGKSVPSR